MHWSYLPLQQNWKGSILVSPCPSNHPSIRLWKELCLLCIFLDTCWIHFIFIHVFKQLLWKPSGAIAMPNLNIWQVFYCFFFLYLQLWLVLFWLWMKWIQYESIIWVIMGRQGLFSERSRSNYTPRFNEVDRGVYWYHLVRLSVCGQKFWQIFKICNFDFVIFWLGIQYDSMVWGNHEAAGGILRTQAF